MHYQMMDITDHFVMCFKEMSLISTVVMKRNPLIHFIHPCQFISKKLFFFSHL